MKIEIIETTYDDLPSGLSNQDFVAHCKGCVSFNSTRETQKLLATHPYSIIGICILTLNTRDVNVYKFAFSCIGDDGTIDTVSKQFELENQIVKSCIVKYAVELITNKGE